MPGTGADKMLVGLRYVDDQCSMFFDSLIEIDRRLEFQKSALITGGTQVQTLMALAKASALNIAKVAAAVEITKVLIEQFQDNFTFSPHTVALRSLVMDSLRKQARDFAALADPNDVTVVVSVKMYAETCTLGNIRTLWDDSIAKAVFVGVKRAGDDHNGVPEAVEDSFSPRQSGVSNPYQTDRYVVR
jgi:hypothetical protein